MGGHTSLRKNLSSVGKSLQRRLFLSQESVSTFIPKKRARMRLSRRIEEEWGNGKRQYGKMTMGVRSSSGSLQRESESRIHTQREEYTWNKGVSRHASDVSSIHWFHDFMKKTCFTQTRFSYKDGGDTRRSSFILDLEGFFINKTFHARELGYYTWNKEHGRHAFRLLIPHQDLSEKDKQTVNFNINKIHGLSYQPNPQEHGQHPRVIPRLVRDLYQDDSTPNRPVVGYKGGHVEKDLLNKLNIPSLNLETLGCPKYDVLRSQDLKYYTFLPSCGFHKDDTRHHCPVTKCHTFWVWYKMDVVVLKNLSGISPV